MLGQRDADSGEPIQASPIGRSLSKVAEDDMEFLDELKTEGFPQDGAERRKARIAFTSGVSCCDTLNAYVDRPQVEQRSYPCAKGRKGR